ncbi:MAG: hypothetical protein JNK82_26500, partial [Myxococcaceae bacterium]|nr:hypothetical protein [Myxococcaceae bacterium]
MDTRLAEFAEVLRQNGLRVGVSETQDAARATAEVGVADRSLFRAALQATLCKRAADVETFDRAFEFFFTGAAKTMEALDASLAARIAEEGLLEGDELTMIVAWLERMRLAPLTQAAVRGDSAALANILRNAALQLDFSRMQSTLQAGFFSRRMMVGAGVEAMRGDLAAISGELQARGVSPQGVEIVARQLGDALRRVEEAARAEVDRQARARLRKPTGGLSDRPFHTLSRAEV